MKPMIKNKRPACNGRFGAMAALAPQQRQCELGSYYPAGTLVKPPLRQAAGTLNETRGQHYRNRKVLRKPINNKIFQPNTI
jgi:hypothetical protein